jgi:hypothetical protein
MAGIYKFYQFYRRDSMLAIFFSIFLILHGMVHLLYAGHSRGFFELRPEMTWPAGAWLVSRLLGDQTTRLVASIALVLATLGYAAGGLGLLLQADWWRLVTVVSAVFSLLLFLVLWDGKFQAVADQGGLGLLINLAILIVILVFNWPV